MAYHVTAYTTIPAQEIANLLREALARIPSPCAGSFIVYYPFVPDCLADRVAHKVQLVGLLPSQQIAAHADQPIQGVRYHVPLQTNEGCWSFHGGQWIQLKVGKVYRMDPAEMHGAVNWGSEVRLHLMIDCEEG